MSEGGAVAAARRAAPSSTGGKIRLTVSVAYQGASTFQGTMQQIIDAYIAQHWQSKNPGVEVTTISGMGCNGTCLGSQDEIANSLAGQPADVIAGCCSQWHDYLVADMLRPLDPFIRQDNLDTSVFSPGHLAGLTTTNGIMAFPEYDGPEVMAVNLSMLDDLGLSYPSDNWTYTDAEKLWRAIPHTVKGRTVTAANVDMPDDWVPVAFGGAVGNANGTRCTLDAAPAVAAYDWWMPMRWAGMFGGGSTQMAQGTCAMSMEGGWDIQSDLFNLRGLKWRYYGLPRFPAGQGTFINNDFYAINSFSKNPPDLVWSIFKFLVLDKGFQQLEWKTTFVTPNQVNLWDDWIQVVYSVAPGLRGKNLEAYAGAVKYGTAQYFFKYEDPTAGSIKGKYFGLIENRQMSVSAGLSAMAREINALQAAGATLAAAGARTAATIQTELKEAGSGKLSAFAAPGAAGVGFPSSAATNLVSVNRGAYALTAAGGGLHATSDNGTFACVTTTAPSATFVCRVTSVASINASPISNGAKFGLMVREDLSNDAPMVALTMSGQEGFLTYARQFAQISPIRQKAGNASTLLLPYKDSSGKAIKEANYLKAPVWLKIERSLNRFACFSSQDGQKWVPEGTPQQVSMAGAWVGLCATSNDSAHQIRVTFDHVTGFLPEHFVTLGS